ncbi:hypothetical protein SEPCBS119000_004468 [Sporothrix epigloea]|uniref:Carboxymuconolactone decarboxylase-like domain-containing protein n=1 Tax=Sporothrix epigloea TaxID=1892477 RepID=A0ABP0DSB4_9PEZI
MRLSYTADPPAFEDPADAAVANRVAARRAPFPLLELDLALLHSPPVADGWNSFFGALRSQTSTITADLRELAISRVAVINQAWYEWGQHAPLATAAGVSDASLAVLLRETPFALSDTTVVDAGLLTALQWAALVYTDEMTRNVAVADATFAHLQTLLNERQIVELTAVIAGYNCVSRFLVALDVGERNGTGPDKGH